MIHKRKNPRAVTAVVAGVLVSLLTSGCATSRKAADGSAEGIQISGSEDPSKQVMANISKPYVSPLGEISLDRTALTEQWIKYFQGRGRRYMEVYLQRSTRYLPMMKNTLRENGLPEDLVYIALIESGFSPLAHSHANAVGYWQFIRGTGKRYGLMLDPFIDERRDPVLSTRAAAEYFKTLYGMLGSWHLSMAAYNVGENRVIRSVAKFKTRDFWELIKNRRAFPKETKHYVPKFIAAALIAKDPAAYGFSNIAYEPPLAFDTVQLANPISMTRLAQVMNTDIEELKLLNPKFRGDYVPQYRGPETVIRVPVGQMKLASAAIPQAFSAVPKIIASDFYFYRVRSGDSLSTIAKKHRTSIATIRRLNNLGNRSFLRVGQKLKVQDRGGSYVAYEMPKVNTASPAPASQSAATATEMANAAPDLKEIQGPNATPAAAEASPAKAAAMAGGTEADVAVSEVQDPNQTEQAEPVKETHVVRRGENLTTIARKYGLTVAELRRLNRLNNRAVLRAGQTLRLRDEEQAKSNAAQDSRRALASKNKTASLKTKSAKSSITAKSLVTAKASVTAKSSKAAKTSVAAKSSVVSKPKSKTIVIAQNLPAKKSAEKIKSKAAKVSSDASVVAKKSNKAMAKSEAQKHKVRKGETLAGIANRYNTTMGALLKKNQIKNKERLLAGSELVIPR